MVYDIGINTSAIPVFEGRGEAFRAIFSEELDENDMPEQRHSHGQYFSATPASYQGEIKPQMMYFGFRYFSVTGNAAVKKVLTVCADVKDTSSFWCEDEMLNWFYSENFRACTKHCTVCSCLGRSRRLGMRNRYFAV